MRLDIILANRSETPAGMQPLPLAKEIANTARDFIDELGKHFVRAPMVKRAMIGCTTKVEVKYERGRDAMEAASYVLDNDLTYGGSGGPVMNLQGELLGIVTRKTTTSARQLRIPTMEQGTTAVLQRIFSGSRLALSHHFVTTIPGLR